MSRPHKEGLDYFPCDVDIFEDDKLFDVQIKYGPLGEIIYIRLLCLIYKNGYYYKYESIDKLAAFLVRSIGNKWARDKQTVVQVISFLAKCNLFSLELMQENVLTSVSIQKRYLKATERRQSINIRPYWLLGDIQQSRAIVHKNGINVCTNSVNVDNNSIDVCNNDTKKRKIYKSKVEAVGLEEDDYQELCNTIGKSDCDYYIERVKAFLKTHPTATFDVKSTILKWHREDVQNAQKENKAFITRTYANEQLDSLFDTTFYQLDI